MNSDLGSYHAGVWELALAVWILVVVVALLFWWFGRPRDRD